MWKSLGQITITTSGTPVRMTSNETDANLRVACQTIFVQQTASNTGSLYFCASATADISTGSGVLAIIPAPTLNSSSVAISLPCAVVTVPDAPAALNAANYYLDADEDGDIALVSVVAR